MPAAVSVSTTGPIPFERERRFLRRRPAEPLTLLVNPRSRGLG